MSESPSRLTAPILLAVACLTIMVGCVIVPGLRQTAAGLHVRQAEWLVTLPALGVILGSPLSGRLIGRVGAYGTLAGGLFSYGLLGAAGPLLSGPVAVYSDRLLLGCATAGIMASGTTLIATFWHAPAPRLRMIAAQGMAIELGGVIFLAIGGLLATMDWRYPFAIYLLAWLLLALLLRFVRPPAAGATDEAERPLAAWPLDIFATATASMLIFFIGVLNLPYSLAAIGLGSSGAGFFLAFVSLVAVGAASQLPRILPRLTEAGTFLLAFAAYLLAFATFAISASLGIDIVAAILLGVGFGLSVPLVNHAIIARSTPATVGPLLATLSLSLFLGQFLASFGAFVPGPIQVRFIIAAVLAASSVLLRLCLQQNRSHQSAPSRM